MLGNGSFERGIAVQVRDLLGRHYCTVCEELSVKELSATLLFLELTEVKELLRVPLSVVKERTE